MEAVPALTEPSADEHFVAHVVQSARDIKASEDIVTVNGTKLLAKGAKVTDSARERLLEHKLAKPLEQCLEVSDSIDQEAVAAAAQKLLDEQPLLRTLHSSTKNAVLALTRLPLTASLRSLLTLYAELPWSALEHPVAVALIAQGIAGKLSPDVAAQERTILTAGLFHDVGELYLDPGIFGKRSLEPLQWRHIVAHPIIGHRVLSGLEGAGKMVAESVLQHHERSDGFGYPQRLGGKALSLRSEALAAAEWLAGLMRSGRSPLTAASAATRLVPGSFRPAIVNALSSRSSREEKGSDSGHARTADVLGSFVRVSETVRRFQDARGWIEEVIARGTEASAVLAANHQRMELIERSFVSTGLAGEEPLVLFERLNSLGDAELLDELGAIARELGWRLRELERDTLLRARSLSADDARLVQEMISRLKRQEGE